MRFDDFTLGSEFVTGSGKRWRVTDLGRRTVIAICLEHPDDPSWYHGPPYAVLEHVFDEHSWPDCQPWPPPDDAPEQQ